MAGGVFVSYRRDDAKHAAGRLVDRLGRTFSSDQLFLDVDNIEPGLDFKRVLSEKVQACDVLLAVIGPGWLQSSDERGARRLDNPKDFVRIEIEAALARDVRVIPVLVDGAHMPSENELPETLRPLAYRNAVRLAHERFASDAEDLTRALAKVLSPIQSTPVPRSPDATICGMPVGPGPKTKTAAPERVTVPKRPSSDNDDAAARLLTRKSETVSDPLPKTDSISADSANERVAPSRDYGRKKILAIGTIALLCGVPVIGVLLRPPSPPVSRPPSPTEPARVQTNANAPEPESWETVRTAASMDDLPKAQPKPNFPTIEGCEERARQKYGKGTTFAPWMRGGSYFVDIYGPDGKDTDDSISVTTVQRKFVYCWVISDDPYKGGFDTR